MLVCSSMALQQGVSYWSLKKGYLRSPTFPTVCYLGNTGRAGCERPESHVSNPYSRYSCPGNSCSKTSKQHHSSVCNSFGRRIFSCLLCIPDLYLLITYVHIATLIEHPRKKKSHTIWIPQFLQDTELDPACLATQVTPSCSSSMRWVMIQNNFNIYTNDHKWTHLTEEKKLKWTCFDTMKICGF